VYTSVLVYTLEQLILLSPNSRRLYAYAEIPSSVRNADKPQRPVKKAAYVTPVILTLVATPAFADKGSKAPKVKKEKKEK
jgi:hypothetical protein